MRIRHPLTALCGTIPIFYALVATIPATAATPSWMINGSTLTGSAAVSTTEHVDQGMEVEIAEAGFTVKCTGGTLNANSPEIIAPNKSAAASVELNECTLSPSECTLATKTIELLPFVGEATLAGALAIKEVIKPTNASNLFATVKIEGSECPGGVYGVAGQSTFLAPTGQDEHTLQLFESTPGSGELKVGHDAAILKGAMLVGLASSLQWSFL